MAAKDDKANTQRTVPDDASAANAYPERTSAPADASEYAIQPTSADVSTAALGDVPDTRFQEQVLKSDAASSAEDSHPVENRPEMGVPPKTGK